MDDSEKKNSEKKNIPQYPRRQGVHLYVTKDRGPIVKLTSIVAVMPLDGVAGSSVIVGNAEIPLNVPVPRVQKWIHDALRYEAGAAVNDPIHPPMTLPLAEIEVEPGETASLRALAQCAFRWDRIQLRGDLESLVVVDVRAGHQRKLAGVQVFPASLCDGDGALCCGQSIAGMWCEVIVRNAGKERARVAGLLAATYSEGQADEARA